MEFGKVQENELNDIDFSLPEEPASNKKILKGKPAKQPKVYLGCAKWGRLEWVGKIYPPDAKEKDFLQYYMENYNSIELNATHYKIYGEAGIKKWADKAKGKDFKFCPKMYQGITHRGTLKGKDFITNEFFRGIVAFEEHLGPIFIQMSDTFSPNRKTELFDYLASLPKDLQFFLEVRHPAWFAKPEIQEELFETLSSLNIGAVITDTAGRRDCAHMHLTIPKTFIRYVGNSLHPSDFTRSDAWVKRIKYWLENGLVELYFMLHMGQMYNEPEMTQAFLSNLENQTGIKSLKPVFH